MAPHSGLSRRDRRGRGSRGPLAWPPLPAMQSRRDSFDEEVSNAAERARGYLGSRTVEFVVEDVPPVTPELTWEEAVPPLGHVLPVPARGRAPGYRIIIYRRPIEVRAGSGIEIAAIIADVVAEQVAVVLGVPPTEISL